jgi:hypothetical protein
VLPYLESEEKLDQFLQAWHGGTLPKTQWSHAAHVAVCATLCRDQDGDAAFAAMKQGILNYAAAIGIEHTETSGYHETLTWLWTQVIHEWMTANEPPTRLDAARGAVQMFGGDRSLHLRYYPFDVARDPRARRELVLP